MYEIVRYSGDFEFVFKKVYELKERVIYWQDKTGKPIKVDTHFFYNPVDEQWEGEFEVTYEKEL
jgi:hypothetical protein